jgi:hypothetical protein
MFDPIILEHYPHVVFQFQHVPVEHRMNDVDSSSKNTNAGGYPASEMRKYLTWVDGNKTENGSFLTGLEKAGVPVEVLWAPSRAMSNKDGAAIIINDLLWLPTEREMMGRRQRRPLKMKRRTTSLGLRIIALAIQFVKRLIRIK